MKNDRETIVEREVARYYVTLDGSVNVGDGICPIGPAIVSVVVDQVREIGGITFRPTATFRIDGRHQWATPAKFAADDVEIFVARHYRNVVPIELDVEPFTTERVNGWEDPLSFGSVVESSSLLDGPEFDEIVEAVTDSDSLLEGPEFDRIVADVVADEVRRSSVFAELALRMVSA